MFNVCIVILAETANREENYQKKSEQFETHSKKMAATAAALAKSGVVTDRKLANDLISTSAKVSGCGLQSSIYVSLVYALALSYIIM